jgi:hypothetical protein
VLYATPPDAADAPPVELDEQERAAVLLALEPLRYEARGDRRRRSRARRADVHDLLAGVFEAPPSAPVLADLEVALSPARVGAGKALAHVQHSSR